MSNEVYANGMAVACKSGDDKVIAAFPDVCLSPPSPPAGPVPVPYPDSSFSKDMQSGSKSVKISGGEVMLKDQSFYKSSPLGNEAATRSFGGSVVTHTITGKTYFNAWSMDVKIEGKNADRHLDLTTSNHASFPGGPPTTALEKQMVADIRAGKCPCCGLAAHATGTPMDADTWYADAKAREGATSARAATKKSPERLAVSVADKQAKVAGVLAKAKARAGCTCPPGTKVLPEPPCNVFFSIPPATPDIPAANKAQKAISEKSRETWYGVKGNPASGYKDAYTKKTGCTEVMHLVPLSAGGCPGAPGKDGNLQCKDSLCNVCKGIDDEFSGIQTVNINN